MASLGCTKPAAIGRCLVRSTKGSNLRSAKKLDIRYLKYAIENESRKQGFGFSNKSGKSKISPIEINIPCDKTKNPDLKLQSLIVDKHESIDQIKPSMEKELAKLEGVTISI